MKRIFILTIAGLLWGNSILHAQDGSAAAVADQQAAQENYQKLAGRVQDLTDALDAQQKRIVALEADLRALREEQSKPNPDVVGRDELKQLSEKVKEIDDKRAADKELILDQIKQLGQVTAALPVTPTKKSAKVKKNSDTPDTTTNNPTAAGGDKNYEGYEYVIKAGDTLSKVVAAYQEQGVKVTVQQILKHPLNTKVNPDKLRVGQKIFIPAPTK